MVRLNRSRRGGIQPAPTGRRPREGRLHVLAHRAVAPARRCVSAVGCVRAAASARSHPPAPRRHDRGGRARARRSVNGDVSAVVLDGQGSQASVRKIASGLREPVGVAFRGGALYVSAVSRIFRFDDIEQRLDHPGKPVVVSDKFPTDGHHGWKFIAFGPDGKLYVPVGAPCNVCEPDAKRYANIMRMNADGSDLEPYARGIRNTVGFDWDPATRELWFTNNGRDNMGDDVPP